MGSLVNFIFWFVIIVFGLLILGAWVKGQGEAAEEEEQKKEEKLRKAQEYGRGKVFRAKR
jgi:uncharacterized membrane protein